MRDRKRKRKSKIKLIDPTPPNAHNDCDGPKEWELNTCFPHEWQELNCFSPNWCFPGFTLAGT